MVGHINKECCEGPFCGTHHRARSDQGRFVVALMNPLVAESFEVYQLLSRISLALYYFASPCQPSLYLGRSLKAISTSVYSSCSSRLFLNVFNRCIFRDHVFLYRSLDSSLIVLLRLIRGKKAGMESLHEHQGRVSYATRHYIRVSICGTLSFMIAILTSHNREGWQDKAALLLEEAIYLMNQSVPIWDMEVFHIKCRQPNTKSTTLQG